MITNLQKKQTKTYMGRVLHMEIAGINTSHPCKQSNKRPVHHSPSWYKAHYQEFAPRSAIHTKRQRAFIDAGSKKRYKEYERRHLMWLERMEEHMNNLVADSNYIYTDEEERYLAEVEGREIGGCRE